MGSLDKFFTMDSRISRVDTGEFRRGDTFDPSPRRPGHRVFHHFRSGATALGLHPAHITSVIAAAFARPRAGPAAAPRELVPRGTVGNPDSRSFRINIGIDADRRGAGGWQLMIHMTDSPQIPGAHKAEQFSPEQIWQKS
ncbi:MAG TPA: hypothetical protein VMV27_17775 [Candidatus Binataceae bacterium]|nr:hypothetical protein [Candidatus Binataceae bacterium]